MLQVGAGAKARVRFAMLVAVVSCVAVVLVAKEFVKPAAKPAKSYALHDEHSDENTTAAVDPYEKPISTRRFCGSRTPFGVGTRGSFSPRPATAMSLRATPKFARASATLLARLSESRWL